MYTECPECQTALPVTAAMLRETRGEVRCGDCGQTFDALERLIDDDPSQAGNGDDEAQAATTSADLLRSLDSLAAGDNVQVEDTGVEWRVLDMDGVNDDDSDTGRHDLLSADADELDAASEDEFREPAPARDQHAGYPDVAATSGADETLRVSIETGTEADWQELLADLDDGDQASDAATTDDVADAAAAADEAPEDDAHADADTPLPDYQPLDAQSDADDSDARPGSLSTAAQRLLGTAGDPDDAADDEQDETLVETIIMEGETITESIEVAERASFDNVPAPDLDADPTLEAAIVQPVARGRPSGSLGLGAALLLGLVLAGQYLHDNREALATNPAFNKIAGPVYAAIGRPVVPLWDIRSWQFEATSGSTDDTDQRLTIYSRVANRGSTALPYPLIHLSLTDRWDDVIGSRVLRPDQYLAGSRQAGQQVGELDSFVAVITVAAPAPEATGFKLNVCYPMGDERLRCAIEDFRE